MPRIVVLDQVLKSWLFRFLTTKVDVIFISQKPNHFLFQFRFERAIAFFFWRSYSLIGNSAGGNTPQAASNYYFKLSKDKFVYCGIHLETKGLKEDGRPRKMQPFIINMIK